jgi:hypothetical protein
VVVKLQEFTDCESKGYDVRCCDTTERFGMMSLYWGIQDTGMRDVCTLQLQVDIFAVKLHFF